MRALPKYQLASNQIIILLFLRQTTIQNAVIAYFLYTSFPNID